jgi:hypothetical protein
VAASSSRTNNNPEFRRIISPDSSDPRDHRISLHGSHKDTLVKGQTKIGNVRSSPSTLANLEKLTLACCSEISTKPFQKEDFLLTTVHTGSRNHICQSWSRNYSPVDLAQRIFLVEQSDRFLHQGSRGSSALDVKKASCPRTNKEETTCRRGSQERVYVG